ncbi:MAG: hypothetical protein HOC81_08555 [Candidatus Marinimicrobia bacterium]|nr:hypothetical protein [Candidatus Neomarinimicrobiota bacterium]
MKYFPISGSWFWIHMGFASGFYFWNWMVNTIVYMSGPIIFATIVF